MTIQYENVKGQMQEVKQCPQYIAFMLTCHHIRLVIRQNEIFQQFEN